VRGPSPGAMRRPTLHTARTAGDGTVGWHLLWFSRDGAARYLSHLDTARALQRTFARAAVPIALSRGMRPKPRLSLVLPLPVGAVGVRELGVVELSAPTAPGEMLARLRAAAPEGIGIAALEPAAARPRPVAVSADYECELDIDVERLALVVSWFAAEPVVTVRRTSPKGARTIDLRRHVSAVTLRGSERGARLGFTVGYGASGAARPEEFVRVLAEKAGADPVMRDLTRTRVAYKEWRGLPPRR
jgi:radical SAM-linked protein